MAELTKAEVEESRAWGRSCLELHATGRPGRAAVVQATAELPLPPAQAYQLMAHPDNAAIFRGIERCTYRRVLYSAAEAGRPGGRQTVEVENESDWHFLWFKGSIRTRMVVAEDPVGGTILVRLAPAGGNAPLQHLHALWRFLPGAKPGSCRVSLEQEVHPRGLPPIFNNGFRAMAAMQARRTFEDLHAEALRMNAGHPSLAPYHTVAGKHIAHVAPEASSSSAAAAGEDPASVLAAAYEAESSASSVGTRGEALVRPGGLRSHPIGSLLDLPVLAGVTGAQLQAEAAAAAAAAAATTAAAAGGDADGEPAAEPTLRQRAYSLLQKLWVVSNAALGAAPNAVAELEEMAVLI